MGLFFLDTYNSFAKASPFGSIAGNQDFQNFMRKRNVLQKDNYSFADPSLKDPDFSLQKPTVGLQPLYDPKIGSIGDKYPTAPAEPKPLQTNPVEFSQTYHTPNVKLANEIVNDLSWANGVLGAHDRNHYKDEERIRNLADNKFMTVRGDNEDLKGDYSVNGGFFRPNRNVLVQNAAIPVAEMGGFCEKGGACYQPPTQLPPSNMPSVTVPPINSGGGHQDIAVRTNNPGNIKWHSWMSRFGASDSGIPGKDGGTFAAFPSLKEGLEAYQTQLFGDTDGVFQSKYYKANTPVDQALKTWSNNGYGAEIYPEVAKLNLGDLTADQRHKLTALQLQKESNQMYQTLAHQGLLQTGGEYVVSPKQLQFILAHGGEVEFL